MGMFIPNENQTYAHVTNKEECGNRANNILAELLVPTDMRISIQQIVQCL